MARSRFPSTPRFATGRPSRRGWLLGWWSLWRVPTLVTIVAALWWFGVRPITLEQGWIPVETAFSLCGEGPRTPGCVLDGDTVLVTGLVSAPAAPPSAPARRIRFTGFDAPELDGACEAERALAQDARAALLAWLQRGPFEWNGAGDPPRDAYGRELREARRVDASGAQERLADTLIAAGLASDSGWGAEPIDWCG
ncbi:MAG: hypothetical protein AAGH57_09645 [Pseudomonadota bacterium]